MMLAGAPDSFTNMAANAMQMTEMVSKTSTDFFNMYSVLLKDMILYQL